MKVGENQKVVFWSEFHNLETCVLILYNTLEYYRRLENDFLVQRSSSVCFHMCLILLANLYDLAIEINHKKYVYTNIIQICCGKKIYKD